MALQTIQLGKILITHKGAWSNAVDYEALDVVSYRGSSYLAILDPPTGTVTTNTTYWRPLSKSAYEYAIEQGYEGTEEEFGVLIDSISDRELSSNKVTSLSSESTDTQYPSAKVTYEGLANKINKDGSNSAIQTLTFMGVTDADVPVELTMQYNKDDGTYNFTLPSGATGQLFQELYFHAKTTEAITEGDAIQYAGAQGRHALVKKAVPSEIRANPYLFMGVATTSAANNAFCKVTWFGNISGVSTTGWSLGNILYFDSANGVSGKLTNVMPTAPNTRINVGVVTLLSTGGASNGTILVRPEFHNKLVDSDDVYAPALTNGAILKWNSTNSRFEVFNVDTALGLKIDKTSITSELGDSEELVMSQKGVKTEVQKLELTNTQQSHSIKQIEDTLNSININQEAKITSEGYGIVSLPKNAANGGMSVKLEGLTEEVEGESLSFPPTGRVRSVGKNLFDKSRAGIGGISSTDGNANASLVNYRYTNYIPVTGGSQYRQNADTSGSPAIGAAFYDSNKLFISGALVGSVSNRTITVPSAAKYVRTCWYIVQKSIDEFQIEKGTTETAYETYRQSNLYLTAPELRSNGLVKDEIRKGANGYELVKRVGVATLGSEIVPQPLNLQSGWTAESGATILSASTFSTTIAGRGVYRASGLTIGRLYRIVVISSSSLRVSRTGSAGILATLTSGVPSYFIAPTNGYIIQNPTTGEATISSLSIAEVTPQDGAIASNSTFLQLGSKINYTLATPVITPIPYAGLLNSNSNGTVYHEPYIADAGVYDSGITIQSTNYPISEIEKIIKWEGGVEYLLNTATAIIAVDGLSFTHPDLADGDLVMFTYAYNLESTVGKMTLTHYDSRYVIADTANGKFYKQKIVATNGVATIQLEEV